MGGWRSQALLAAGSPPRPPGPEDKLSESGYWKTRERRRGEGAGSEGVIQRGRSWKNAATGALKPGRAAPPSIVADSSRMRQVPAGS